MSDQLVFGYRIYPSWFRQGGYSLENGPIAELARGSAERMGRMVVDIEIVRSGADHRGFYTDFDVTYSSPKPLHEWLEDAANAAEVNRNAEAQLAKLNKAISIRRRRK